MSARTRYRVELVAGIELSAGALIVDGEDASAAIAEALAELEDRLRDAGFDTRSAPALVSSRVSPVRWVGRPAGPLRPCRACGATIGFARVDGRAVPVDPDGAAHGACDQLARLPGRPVGAA